MTTVNCPTSLKSALEMEKDAIKGMSFLMAAKELYSNMDSEVSDTPDLQQAIETGESVLEEIITAIVDYENPVEWEREYRKGASHV